MTDRPTRPPIPDDHLEILKMYEMRQASAPQRAAYERNGWQVIRYPVHPKRQLVFARMIDGAHQPQTPGNLIAFPASDPRHHANAHGRGYITPEDVAAAFDAGGDASEVRRVVLAAIAAVNGFGCEDVGVCAYVAQRGNQ